MSHILSVNCRSKSTTKEYLETLCVDSNQTSRRLTELASGVGIFIKKGCPLSGFSLIIVCSRTCPVSVEIDWSSCLNSKISPTQKFSASKKISEIISGQFFDFFANFFSLSFKYGSLLKCRQFKNQLRKILDYYENVDILEICLDSHKFCQL